ncbi:hypothetical protein Gohar_013615 [Gossypium harknessii]|uniref:CCHC-type domain-containing protein n=1 Tax=Gossypium harknessii TaxID=34285 RepID=A0A7J9H337_9ROSI|nr:hypothetical protein [Gossypium harknessii]
MLIDPFVEQQISWRDKLVGHPSKTVSNDSEEKEDCDFLEGDIQKSLGHFWTILESSALDGVLKSGTGLSECGDVMDKASRFAGPLVSQILINGKAQRVEYEFLLSICFHCGRYGHVKGSCTCRVPEPNAGKEPTPSEVAPENHSILVDGQEE